MFSRWFLPSVMMLIAGCDPADRLRGRYTLARCGEQFNSGEYFITPIPCDVASGGSTQFTFVDSGTITLGSMSQRAASWDVYITYWNSGVPTRDHEMFSGTYTLEGSTVRLELEAPSLDRERVDLTWDGARRLTWKWTRKDALFGR